MSSKDALKKYVFFPKLYRRLKDYFVETSASSLKGFDAWIRADPLNRDDTVWIEPLREMGNLHDTYKVTPTRIKMLYRTEELVFQSQGSLVAPVGRGVISRLEGRLTRWPAPLGEGVVADA